MNVRARVRRAFPYLVIAVIGFALAYVIVLVFVLPTKIVPPEPTPYHPDSAQFIPPVDSGLQPAPNPVTVAPPVGPGYAPPPAPLPVDVPDLVGMALPDARGVLNTLQLNTVVTRDTSSVDAPNTVIRQSPPAGAKVPEHGTVTVTASYFPPTPDASRASATKDSGQSPPAESTAPPVRRPLPPIQPADTSTPTPDQ